MRFMMIRKADANTEAGVLPTQEQHAAMGAYMEEFAKAGVLLAGDGLQPSSKGARVKFNDGRPTVVDGPFAETKELIAGYAVIEAKSLAEAIEWAKRWPTVEGEKDVELEIRPIFEADDFGEEFTPELREAEERMRAQIGDQRGN